MSLRPLRIHAELVEQVVADDEIMVADETRIGLDQVAATGVVLLTLTPPKQLVARSKMYSQSADATPEGDQCHRKCRKRSAFTEFYRCWDVEAWNYRAL